MHVHIGRNKTLLRGAVKILFPTKYVSLLHLSYCWYVKLVALKYECFNGLVLKNLERTGN